jgi:hypothetical protein
MQEWKCLNRFLQQGWEVLNAFIKSYFFRRAKRGDLSRNSKNKSKLLGIARWLQCCIMWYSGNGDLLFCNNNNDLDDSPYNDDNDESPSATTDTDRNADYTDDIYALNSNNNVMDSNS